MKLEEILIPQVQEAVKSLYGIEITAEQVQLQKTRAEFEGDITLVVFPFVKAARKAPAMVAQELGEKLLEFRSSGVQCCREIQRGTRIP